jgi:phytoene/squalene synthetase
VQDYDLYCHYVAGLVGIGLSQLFASSGRLKRWKGEPAPRRVTGHGCWVTGTAEGASAAALQAALLCLAAQRLLCKGCRPSGINNRVG